MRSAPAARACASTCWISLSTLSAAPDCAFSVSVAGRGVQLGPGLLARGFGIDRRRIGGGAADGWAICRVAGWLGLELHVTPAVRRGGDRDDCAQARSSIPATE